MSITFVDGTTPLNAANLNLLEQKANKNVANGYAGLGANSKIAVAQGGVPDPVVNGQWIKGVGGAAVWAPITAGDITSAVNGQFLKGVGGVGAWAALAPSDAGLPKITTSVFSGGPPASPASGDIWIASDCGADGAGTRWAFQYNGSSSSAYKWEHIGGAPYQMLAHPYGSGVTINLQSWANFSGPPYLTGTPRAGDYWVELGADCAFSAPPTYFCFVGVEHGSTMPGDYDFLQFVCAVNSADNPSGGWKGNKVTIAAGEVVQMVARVNAASAYIYNLRMKVTPIRVS